MTETAVSISCHSLAVLLLDMSLWLHNKRSSSQGLFGGEEGSPSGKDETTRTFL